MLARLFRKSGENSAPAESPAPDPGPALREVPLNHDLLNGWRAEKVSYFKGSSAATIFFSHEDGKQTCVAGIDLCQGRGGLGRIVDSSARAFHYRGGLLDQGAFSGLENRVVVAVEMDILNRNSHEKSLEKPGAK